MSQLTYQVAYYFKLDNRVEGWGDVTLTVHRLVTNKAEIDEVKQTIRDHHDEFNDDTTIVIMSISRLGV